jgi:hypothetical protein
MPKLAALALSVGVLAVIAVWLFGQSPLVAAKMQVWQAFIAWGCHFQAGGKLQGSRNTLLCMVFGAIVGMVAALAIPHLGVLSGLAAPVAVGVGAAVIVVASKVPLLETIPASVYGFAAIFGLLGLSQGLAPTAAILPTALSVLVGVVFGYVSEIVADVLTRKDIALEPGVGKPA